MFNYETLEWHDFSYTSSEIEALEDGEEDAQRKCIGICGHDEPQKSIWKKAYAALGKARERHYEPLCHEGCVIRDVKGSYWLLGTSDCCVGDNGIDGYTTNLPAIKDVVAYAYLPGFEPDEVEP